MQAFSRSSLPIAVEALPLRPAPPGWVIDLFGSSSMTPRAPQAAGHDLSLVAGTDFTLVTVRLCVTSDEPASRLADDVKAAYGSVAAELGRRHQFPIRIWNFIPDIQGAITGADDRYMAFNMGRFAAYSEWFGGQEAFGQAVPTSSAIGITGDALWLHALACGAPGQPVENPRQVPSYRYSERYGVRPPCFARATRIGGRVLIGGTASILGEHSHHVGDVEQQTEETFQNIAALLASASTRSSRRSLDLLRSLRVHVRDASDAATVRAIVAERASHVDDIEFVQAFLCRKELLVEIEGVAEC